MGASSWSASRSRESWAASIACPGSNGIPAVVEGIVGAGAVAVAGGGGGGGGSEKVRPSCAPWVWLGEAWGLEAILVEACAPQPAWIAASPRKAASKKRDRNVIFRLS
jgi:hypothetical protein